jgi:hypothetical protein
MAWIALRLKSFTEKGVRAIRNKLKDTPSKVDDVVQMIGRLWRYAKEHQGMEDLGPDPAGEVARIHKNLESHKRGRPNCATRSRRTRTRRSCGRTTCCAIPGNAEWTWPR